LHLKKIPPIPVTFFILLFLKYSNFGAKLMMRKVLGIFVGVILCVLLILGAEVLSHLMYTPPAGIDPTDMEQLKAQLKEVPVVVLLWVVLGHFVALFCGNWVGLKISGGHRPTAYTISGIMALMVVFNSIALLHPLWFVILDGLAVLLALVLPLKLVPEKTT
ncbi:MAG: hypothetical protein WDZ35_15320, partial [Crocinitomicaceae bacterium]